MTDSDDRELLERLVATQSHELEVLRSTLADIHSASDKLLSLPSYTQDEATLAQQGIEVLVALIQARYGAVGLLDDDGNLTHFLYTGLTPEERDRIAILPEGKGLLGAVIKDNQILCLENLDQDPRSAGFPANHPPMTTLLAAPISHGNRVYGRVYLSDKNDDSFFVESDKQLVTTFANTLGLVLHNAQVAAQQRRSEEELRLAAKVIENTLEGVIVTDTAFNILSVNPAFSHISGYQPEEIIGKPIDQIHCQECCPNATEQMSVVLQKDGHWRGELWCVKKNSKKFPYSSSISAIKDDDGNATCYVVICRDITEQKKTEAKLDHLAHHDPLTSLPNRLLFEDRLQQKIAYARRHSHSLALMFLDLDLFKLVNDSLGHEIGDLLLQSVAQRLQGCVRDSDTVARLGGDEFTIILDNTGVSGADAIAHKIRLAMSQPFDFAGQQLHVTASIGLGLFPQDGEEPTALVKSADMAMYHAKDIGNTHCFYTGTMGNDANEQLILEEQLYTALEHDELRLTFQPKLDLVTEKIVGAKVLLRWQHPSFGLVKPRSFIPLAEQTGLIVPIGEWVLNTACKQCKLWQETTSLIEFRVTIALSQRQFAQADLVSMVTNALSEAHLSPYCLELEISEVAAVNQPGAAAEKLGQLRALGVGIIVTDIGSEEASYDAARQFAADTLKIDSSFTSADKRANSDITEGLIAKAHGLKLRVVAEGVETKAQLAFLRSKQCDEVLGYYFSHPVSATEFGKLLSAKTPISD